MDLFHVLGNTNRRNILQILMKKEAHIAQLARELGISNPVALKHVVELEKAGMIEREKIGNSHVLRVKIEAVKTLKLAFGLFEESFTVSVPKGTNVLDALKKVSSIKVEKKPDGIYITEIDGKKGHYIFEVNGKLPDKPADQFLLEKDSEIELKRLLPIVGKKIIIKIG
ncbi:MAG: helix-turn-helix domain-containing protein [Candidatus Diapherotrites archaeon]|nr:helix-turn-helix domain-containing protein [Candidatus Diapherotrites archaeon]